MSKSRRTHFDTDTAAPFCTAGGCWPTREERIDAALVVGAHPDRFSTELQREARALLARSGRHGAREARLRIERELQRSEASLAAA